MPKTTKPAPNKVVRLTIEMDAQFIALLHANCQLSEAIRKQMQDDPARQLDPKEVLAMLVLAEARGGTPEQIHAMTPLDWRAILELLHDERQVFEGGKLISKPTGTRKFLQDFLAWAQSPFADGNRSNLIDLVGAAQKLVSS